MEFSRPEYWSTYSFRSPEDLPNPGIEPRSPALQAESLPSEPQGKQVKPSPQKNFSQVGEILTMSESGKKKCNCF